MTEMTSCLHVRQLLGVYVVGAIDPAERAQVDLHLAGCPDCREELAGLAGLPALLGRVPFSEAEQIAGFPSVKTGIFSERTGPGGLPDAGPGDSEILTPLLAKAAQRRRASRWRNLAAAAAVALIAAGTAIGAIHITQGPVGGSVATTSHWESAQGTAPGTNVTADVRYRAEPWGTQLSARVSGIAPGTTCQLWVIGAHGQKSLAGSWTVAGGGWQNESYGETVALPASAVHAFQITAAGKPLVTVNAT